MGISWASNLYLVGGWPTPVRQLGWWHSQYMEKYEVMFQTTNQYMHWCLHLPSWLASGSDWLHGKYPQSVEHSRISEEVFFLGVACKQATPKSFRFFSSSAFKLKNPYDSYVHIRFITFIFMSVHPTKTSIFGVSHYLEIFRSQMSGEKRAQESWILTHFRCWVAHSTRWLNTISQSCWFVHNPD